MASSRPLTRIRSWTAPRLVHLARMTVVGVLSGAIAGLLAGGVGSRVAMRIAAIAGGDSIEGLKTENGNLVGDITVEGTVVLLFFGGLFPGVFAGLIYVAVRQWLPGPRLWGWNGLMFGLLLYMVFGSAVIDADNVDFSRFGPTTLNIFMFSLLFPLFGLLVAFLADPISRWLAAAPGHLRLATIAYVTLIPFSAMMLIAMVALVASEPLTMAVLSLLLLALMPTAAKSGRIEFATSNSPGVTILGYGLMGIPCVAGLVLLVRAINEIV